MNLGNVECRLKVSKLSLKILLAESYLLHISTKWTGNLEKTGGHGTPRPPLESPLFGGNINDSLFVKHYGPCCLLLITASALTRFGQTFSTKGHSEDFIATGAHYIYRLSQKSRTIYWFFFVFSPYKNLFFYVFNAEGEQFEHLLWLWSINLLLICMFIKICMVHDF